MAPTFVLVLIAISILVLILGIEDPHPARAVQTVQERKIGRRKNS